MYIYYGVCVCIFGLVFGSFLNCTAMRLVRGEDFVRGRSRCPLCGHELSAIELIPVVSFLIQKGRCRHCRGRISPRYCITEIVFAVLSLGLFIRLILGRGDVSYAEIMIFFRDWILTGCLFIITLTDLENFEIYDGVLLFGFLDYILFSAILLITADISIKEVIMNFASGLLTGAVILIFSLIMDSILKKDSLGGGDIKLFALLGLFLGFFGAYELIVISCLLGLAFAGIRRLLMPEAPSEFPFGPAIAASGYILLLFEKNITGWYLGFLL